MNEVISFLKEIPIEAIVFSLLISFFLFWFIIIIIDNFTCTKIGTGKILEKKFIPEEWIGLVYYPDRWELNILTDNGKGNVLIDNKYYSYVSINQDVAIEYKIGRLTKNVYIVKVFIEI